MSATEVRYKGLDQFYTIPEYSCHCINIMNSKYDISEFDIVVEPSAGSGSFYNQVTHESKIGIDISPQCDGIIKMNYFDYNITDNSNKVLVIGNPPFGKNSSLAIKFFNHSSKFAHVIAFIVPRTFRKHSVQNKISMDFHLIHDEDVPTTPCCFEPKMMAKCCFQIWERRDYQRKKIVLSTKHADWEFLSFGPLDDKGQPTPPDGADFAMRAYGGKIGMICEENLNNLRPKSWHWIKCNIDKKELIRRFNLLDYSNSTNTARQNSMGRGELVSLYTKLVVAMFE
tara:strand:+ start:2452 stop:3303 length:852 start_codon:yes stop_codon:yes gene_type:complete